MFPQRRRNSLSKIMRVICGFTSCVLTLATLAIVPIAPSSASTEETTPKTSERAEIKGNQELKNKDEHKSDKKAEQQPVSNLEQHTSATANTNPKNEVSNKDKEADQNSKNKKAKNAAEAAQTGSNGDRSSTNTTENGAQFYNPEYLRTLNIVAGNLSTSANNKSGAPRSKPIHGNRKIKRGYLPVGTRFEIKPDAND